VLGGCSGVPRWAGMSGLHISLLPHLDSIVLIEAEGHALNRYHTPLRTPSTSLNGAKTTSNMPIPAPAVPIPTDPVPDLCEGCPAASRPDDPLLDLCDGNKASASGTAGREEPAEAE
jgi:hypothetical protein